MQAVYNNFLSQAKERVQPLEEQMEEDIVILQKSQKYKQARLRNRLQDKLNQGTYSKMRNATSKNKEVSSMHLNEDKSDLTVDMSSKSKIQPDKSISHDRAAQMKLGQKIAELMRSKAKGSMVEADFDVEEAYDNDKEIWDSPKSKMKKSIFQRSGALNTAIKEEMKNANIECEESPDKVNDTNPDLMGTQNINVSAFDSARVELVVRTAGQNKRLKVQASRSKSGNLSIDDDEY